MGLLISNWWSRNWKEKELGGKCKVSVINCLAFCISEDSFASDTKMTLVLGVFCQRPPLTKKARVQLEWQELETLIPSLPPTALFIFVKTLLSCCGLPFSTPFTFCFLFPKWRCITHNVESTLWPYLSVQVCGISALTLLCSHHHRWSPELCHHPSLKLCPHQTINSSLLPAPADRHSSQQSPFLQATELCQK